MEHDEEAWADEREAVGGLSVMEFARQDIALALGLQIDFNQVRVDADADVEG